MSENIPNRQQLSGNDEQERLVRQAAAMDIARVAINRSSDHLVDPQSRLDFLANLDGDGFYNIAQYVNAKMRNEKPAQLRNDPAERGAFLPILHTPSTEDKIPAFKNGYRAIKEYIEQSQEPIDVKASSVAMAVEALIIWTHPFNDGNGRTSRFIAKMIENGTTDIDGLISQTAWRANRPHSYDSKLATREGQVAMANNEDILLDEDERDELRTEAEKLPSDIDAMYLSVHRLLHNKSVQQHALRHVKPQQSAA